LIDVRVTPKRLNLVIALAFAVGSICFILGTVPWYAERVGAAADAITFFVGSLFFTTASSCQLLQAQTPAMNPSARVSRPTPLSFRRPQVSNTNWRAAAAQFPGTLAFNVSTAFAISTSLTIQRTDRLVWAPDLVGSVLFLVASWLGIVAVSGRVRAWLPHNLGWVIAWVNMVGSVFFMASALGAVILPATGAEADARLANVGTFAGAVCFFVGAILLVPAWRRAARVTG
jgi:hypothetical protein